MADAQKSAAFDHSKLLDAVSSIDSKIDKNDGGITLEELRKASRWYSEELMQHLRSAALELRSETKPNPEKIAALRTTLERLSALNDLKSSQEKEIRALYDGEMKDFFELFTELRGRLDGLKSEVSKPSAPEKAAVAPKASKTPEKPIENGFSAKRDFLLADKALFENSKGERSTGFSREQLRKLISDKRVVGNETSLDLLVMRLAGSPLNLANEEEAKAVRTRFVEAISLRLTTLSELYERTVGEKIGDKKSSGGLLHILMGKEHVLVGKIFSAAEYLEAKGVTKGSGLTFEEIAETLKGIGLGLLLGPVYLEMRSRKGIADSEIKTGEKSDKLGWRTSDSKTNLELRVTPALKIFGVALGIVVEANANLNHREAEIVGKVKEAAKAYDEVINPETGLMDVSKAPNPEDAKAYNAVIEQMRTGDAARDKILARSFRDANLLEFANRLVRLDSGFELKGLGAGVALLFGILPVKAFIKINGENLSAKVAPAKVDGLSAQDAIRLSSGNISEFGIALAKTPEGKYEYAIDPARNYVLENRTGLKLENGAIKSDKPLYFRHLEVVSDSIEAGGESVHTLVISETPFEPGNKASTVVSEKKDSKESIYVAKSNDALRNDVVSAMRGITSRHIRYKATGIPALQEAISRASVSGNPEEAYELLSSVKVEGKRPLAALAAAHSKDSPSDKRELLNLVLQETAGDWRIRNFDAIKTDSKAFENFVSRTGYRGTQKDLKLSDVASAWDLGTTFDKNFLAKTGLGKLSKNDQKEALGAISSARSAFSNELGKLDSIDKNTREIKNAIGFVNFHQVAIDAQGKTHKRFQDVVPVSGTVKSVDVEPTKFENAAVRRELVAEIPVFVLESLRKTINAQAKSVGAEEIASVDDVRKLLVNNGSKAEGSFRPDIELSSELAYTRFAKCLNDTYLIQNINLCVTGPNGQAVCNPEIPQVTSDLIAPVGRVETNVTNLGIGAAFSVGSSGGGGGGNNNGGPGGTTTPGVSGGPGNVVAPGAAAGF